MNNKDNHQLHVIFGTGPVGMAVMDELVHKQKRVRLVNRRGQANAPTGVEVVKGDATDPASTRHLCQGAAVVYNCTNAPYAEWPEKFPPLQAGVLAGAAAAGARLVVMENVYMYGAPNGRPLTEDLPYAAITSKGQTRARMAAELLAAHKKGIIQVAIGRASDFFGPGVYEAAMGERIFYPALAGKPVWALGNLDLPHTQTYVPDIGKGLVILGEREEALGRAWHLPSPETVSTRRFIEMIFAEAGHAPSVRSVPKIMLQGMGLFNSSLAAVVEMLYQFEEPFIVKHDDFAQAFGNHATPLPEAIRTTVDWFRRNPR